MNTEILEMARIACATVPDDLCEQMDISDDHLVELRDHIHSLLKVEARHWAGDLDHEQGLLLELPTRPQHPNKTKQ